MSPASGPGWYQMALVPLSSRHVLGVESAYVSASVRLYGPAAVYHVYLEEEATLQTWWRKHGGAPGGIHVLIFFRGSA